MQTIGAGILYEVGQQKNGIDPRSNRITQKNLNNTLVLRDAERLRFPESAYHNYIPGPSNLQRRDEMSYKPGEAVGNYGLKIDPESHTQKYRGVSSFILTHNGNKKEQQKLFSVRKSEGKGVQCQEGP